MAIDINLLFPRRFNKTYKIAAGLAAGLTQNIGITENDSTVYSPFNTIIINNTSSQLISFLPDNNEEKKIPCEGSFAFDDANFRTASIKNEDAANATSEAVYITVMNTVNFRTLVIALRQILENIKVKM